MTDTITLTGADGVITSPELSRAIHAEVVNLVREKSVIAKLGRTMPIKFNSTDVVTLNLSLEADLVGESKGKTRGSADIVTFEMRPYKFEYGARFSLEAYHSDHQGVIDEFQNGIVAKFANALDIASLHGVNPRTGEKSELIGGNCFAAQITNTILDSGDTYTDMNAAIAKIQGLDNLVTGAAFAPLAWNNLANTKDKNNRPLFEEIGWGLDVESIKGLPVAVSSNVSFNDSGVSAVVGDFENGFRWGIANDLTLSIIGYGDPDNTGRDLAGHNEFYCRGEIFYSWAILNPDSFVLIHDENYENDDDDEK